MAKEHAWMWVLGGVVVLYAIGSNQRAQAAAAAAAAGLAPPATSTNPLSALFGGLFGQTAPATAASSAAGALPGGGFYNPQLPANYQPVNYNGSPAPSPNAVPLGNSSGLQDVNYGSPANAYTSPYAAMTNPSVFAV